MYDLFKGYVPTRNKECLMKFKGKSREELKSLREVSDLPEYAGILNDNTVLVDIDNMEQSEILANIVEDKQLRCRIIKTTKGRHFYFLNDERIEKNCTGKKLACGITSDIKLGSRTSYSILKFADKERETEYDIFQDEEYEPVPKWLLPIGGSTDFFKLGSGEGRNQKLFNYILSLQSNDFSVDECRECIGIINKYILPDPLDKTELNTVLRDDAFKKPVFFKGKTFLFDKFAIFLKNNSHIVRINDTLHVYKDGVYVEGQRLLEHEMIKHIPDLNKAKRLEVLSYLDVIVKDNIQAAPPYYIAFKNGIFDIRTKELSDFDPNIIITNKIEFDYMPGSYSEAMNTTLNKLSCNDEQIRMLLEEMVGYCFFRRNELRKSIILTGGRENGKSTFLSVLGKLLGKKNTSGLDLRELGERFKTAELAGKLANIGDDIEGDFIPNPAIFKKLSSGNTINVERKSANPFDFNNYAKLIFSANDIPKIKDKTGAVLSRLIIIPFNATFSKTDADYDPYIIDKLTTDEAIEYLILLGLEGLERILTNKSFTPSTRVEACMEAYQLDNSPLLLFCTETENDRIINEPTSKVYMTYKEFCILNNFVPLSKIEFSKQLKKHLSLDIKDKTINGKKYRIFVKIKEDRHD